MTDAPETIHDRGRVAVLRGAELLDRPPAPNGDRWGLSLVVRPDAQARARLDELSAQAAALAGSGQWRTGAADSSHLTVCYLERGHRRVTAGDPAVRAAARLAADAVSRAAPLRWQVTGLALADRGVLALAEPVDAAPDAFRADVLSRLGDHGREEARYRRSVWWATLVHFAVPVAQRRALVDWVDARRSLVGAERVLVSAERIDVVRYDYDQRLGRTRPTVLASHEFTDAGGCPAAHA